MEEEVEKQKYSSHPQAKKVDVHKHHSMISSLSKEKNMDFWNSVNVWMSWQKIKATKMKESPLKE